MRIRKPFKTLTFIATILISVAIAFYFWASSANHPQSEYSRLITNEFPEVKKTDSTYSVITYNLGYLSGMTNNLPVERTKELFDNNLRTVQRELDLYQPNIICLQEVDYHAKRSYFVNQQEALIKQGYNYAFQAVNWDINYLPFPHFPVSAHFGETYSGQSVLSKFPIIEYERIVLTRLEDAPFYRQAFYLDRLAQVVKISLDDKTLILINVHLEAFDKPTRVKQTKRIIQLYNTYKNEFPVLLVGDFNSDISDNNPTIQPLVNIPGIQYTVPISAKTYPADKPSKRLDYIFYNERFIELKKSEVLLSFGRASDHLPVMMKFILK